MKNIVIGIAIFIALIIAGALIFTGGDKIVREEEGKFDKISPFTLSDWNGNAVSLSDFEGRPLILNSWAAWCPFCVKELPAFGALQEELGNSVVIIAINRAESTERQKGFIDNLRLTDKLIFLNDPHDSFYKSIGGFGMPETLFVDGKGNIRLHKRGPIGLEELRRTVRAVF